MSSLPLVIKMTQFGEYSNRQLGDTVEDLAWLNQYLATPPALLIPPETLEKILLSAHAVLKLKQLLEHQGWQQATKVQKIRAFFRALPLPSYFVSTIHAEYRQYLKSEVSVFAAHTRYGRRTTLVSGETNLLSAIKEFWADLVIETMTQSLRDQHVQTPSGIVVQQVPEGSIFGHIASHHHGGIHKSVLVIQAQKKPSKQAQHIEEYQVDVRSLAVVVRPQSRAGGRTQQPAKPTLLNDNQCRELASLSAPTFRQRLKPLALQWTLTKDGFVFHNLLKSSQKNDFSKKKHAVPTATKVFVTANSISRMYASAPLIDGVGPVTSRYLVHSAGVHPVGALHDSAAQTVLKQNIQRAIYQLASISPRTNLLYTLYSAPRAQRAKLLLAENELALAEDLSQSTGLAYLLTFPRWLDFEFTTLLESIEHHQLSVQIVIPDVKLPDELVQLYSVIKKSKLGKVPTAKFLMEVASPSAVLGLSAFPTNHLAGYCLNLPVLLARTLAVSPKILRTGASQHLSTVVTLSLLSEFAKQLALIDHSIAKQVVVVVDQLETPVIRKIVSLGWYGISTSPDQLLSLRSEIQSAERLVLEHKL